MDNLNSEPETELLASDVHRKPRKEKEKIILSIAQSVISKTVDLARSGKTRLSTQLTPLGLHLDDKAGASIHA